MAFYRWMTQVQTQFGEIPPNTQDGPWNHSNLKSSSTKAFQDEKDASHDYMYCTETSNVHIFDICNRSNYSIDNLDKILCNGTMAGCSACAPQSTAAYTVHILMPANLVLRVTHLWTSVSWAATCLNKISWLSFLVRQDLESGTQRKGRVKRNSTSIYHQDRRRHCPLPFHKS